MTDGRTAECQQYPDFWIRSSDKDSHPNRCTYNPEDSDVHSEAGVSTGKG